MNVAVRLNGESLFLFVYAKGDLRRSDIKRPVFVKRSVLYSVTLDIEYKRLTLVKLNGCNDKRLRRIFTDDVTEYRALGNRLSVRTEKA